MHIAIIDVAGMRLAGLRHQGPYQRISETFVSLFPKVGHLGPPEIPDAAWTAVYQSDPAVVPVADLVSFATITVDENADIGELEEVRVPPGRYARGQFIGPHSALAGGWSRFAHLLEERGYAIREGEVTFEVYLNQAAGTPEDQLRTDLYFPVK